MTILIAGGWEVPVKAVFGALALVTALAISVLQFWTRLIERETAIVKLQEADLNLQEARVTSLEHPESSDGHTLSLPPVGEPRSRRGVESPRHQPAGKNLRVRE